MDHRVCDTGQVDSVVVWKFNLFIVFFFFFFLNQAHTGYPNVSVSHGLSFHRSEASINCPRFRRIPSRPLSAVSGT